MRSDFLDRVAEDPRFLDELTRGLVFLRPPDRDGLREALVAAGRDGRLPVRDAGDGRGHARRLDGTPGALPLLQFAAAKLWDARDRAAPPAHDASYNAIGGIAGALATHADDVVAQHERARAAADAADLPPARHARAHARDRRARRAAAARRATRRGQRA